ncbi:unnamed protein product [Periconia digitata]|uniref:Uncharacterized protein n=1 Tax=Periconia digitata TaxID=1303443 RepID=A0A9W4UKR3_9PLEO|nr:unnamed protein product [Periconia digitata]
MTGLAKYSMATQRLNDPKLSPNALNLTVLGICAEASLSGVSCILLRYRQQSPEEQLLLNLIRYEEIAVPWDVRTPILNLLRDRHKHPQHMLRVHDMVGHMLSTTIERFCGNQNISVDSVDLAATQADSVPPSVLPSSDGASWKAEIDPRLQNWTKVILERTGITTIASLPTNRRPLNRRGPSLQVFMDNLYLRHATKFRVCLTIDDFLTVTAIPPEESTMKVTSTPFAYCGPGTLFIDYAMRYATSNQMEHDYTGAYGERGSVNENLVNRFLDVNDYTRRALPTTMAVEMFGQHEIQSLIEECSFIGISDLDAIATITRITSEIILSQYRRVMAEFSPSQKVDEVFICGRGAKNLKIVERLEEVLPEEVMTRPFDDIGIPGDAKCAAYCAHFGLELALGQVELEMGFLSDESQKQQIQEALVKGRRWDILRDRITRFAAGKQLPPMQQIVVNRG